MLTTAVRRLTDALTYHGPGAIRRKDPFPVYHPPHTLPLAASPEDGARYAPALIVLHWLTALTILAAVLLAVGREILDIPGADKALLAAHRAVGPAVLILLALRLPLRLFLGAPDHAGMAPATRRVATAAHAVLYLLLAAVPLLGWAATSALGKPVTLFGLVPLPALTGVDEDLADLLGDAHSFVAWTLVGLAGLHAVAALWHHLAERDGVLVAMLPERLSRRLETSRDA
jgi:cytochrome b561